MNTQDMTNTMTTLLRELLEGPPKHGGYMLNPGDPGLFRSLDRVSAAEARD